MSDRGKIFAAARVAGTAIFRRSGGDSADCRICAGCRQPVSARVGPRARVIRRAKVSRVPVTLYKGGVESRNFRKVAHRRVAKSRTDRVRGWPMTDRKAVSFCLGHRPLAIGHAGDADGDFAIVLLAILLSLTPRGGGLYVGREPSPASRPDRNKPPATGSRSVAGRPITTLRRSPTHGPVPASFSFG